MDLIRVFVGSDRSQMIGVKALEHSIKRFTRHPVEVTPMIDLPVRPPRDPKQDQRTGFSFSRFCIPKLCGYQGKAIYMDADMLVFRDISELWNLPFDGAKVLVQEPLSPARENTEGKRGAPDKRIKQSSVMLLDCARLDWDIEKIIQGLDEGRYDYGKLLYELCILPEAEIGLKIPFRWNSLEHFDSQTANIHYTDMGTQPWVWSGNPHGAQWVNEVRLMLEDGTLKWADLEKEIALGYARPSLRSEVANPTWRTVLPYPFASKLDWVTDRLKGYRPHRVAHQDRQRHLASLRVKAGLEPLPRSFG